MTSASRRLSDPESVLSKIEEARNAFGDLAGLIGELAAARGRLEALESRLHTLSETTNHLNEAGASTLSAARDEVSRLEQRTGKVLSELDQDRVRHDTRVEALLRDAHQTLDALMVASQAKTDEAVEQSQMAVGAVAAARTELTTAFERFRQEQLTKLDDVSISHNLLSNRQRESEATAQRHHSDLANRVDDALAAARRTAEQLDERITGTVHIVDELGRAVEAARTRQTEQMEAARETHARELARVRRTIRLQGALLALPSVGALVGVVALLIRG